MSGLPIDGILQAPQAGQVEATPVLGEPRRRVGQLHQGDVLTAARGDDAATGLQEPLSWPLLVNVLPTILGPIGNLVL